MTKQLTFKNQTLKLISHNGRDWIRGLEICTTLGYKDPEAAAKRLYHEHKDEFTPTMTQVMRVRTNGGEQLVRVFCLRGAHLLAMFARTPIAKDFRKWVLDVLEAHTASPQPQLALPSPDADYWRKQAYSTRDCYEAMLGRIYTRVDVLKTLFERMNVSLPPVMLEVIGEQLTGINAVIMKR